MLNDNRIRALIDTCKSNCITRCIFAISVGLLIIALSAGTFIGIAYFNGYLISKKILPDIGMASWAAIELSSLVVAIIIIGLCICIYTDYKSKLKKYENIGAASVVVMV